MPGGHGVGDGLTLGLGVGVEVGRPRVGDGVNVGVGVGCGMVVAVAVRIEDSVGVGVLLGIALVVGVDVAAMTVGVDVGDVPPGNVGVGDGVMVGAAGALELPPPLPPEERCGVGDDVWLGVGVPLEVGVGTSVEVEVEVALGVDAGEIPTKPVGFGTGVAVGTLVGPSGAAVSAPGRPTSGGASTSAGAGGATTLTGAAGGGTRVGVLGGTAPTGRPTARGTMGATLIGSAAAPRPVVGSSVGGDASTTWAVGATVAVSVDATSVAGAGVTSGVSTSSVGAGCAATGGSTSTSGVLAGAGCSNGGGTSGSEVATDAAWLSAIATAITMPPMPPPKLNRNAWNAEPLSRRVRTAGHYLATTLADGDLRNGTLARGLGRHTRHARPDIGTALAALHVVVPMPAVIYKDRPVSSSHTASASFRLPRSTYLRTFSARRIASGVPRMSSTGPTRICSSSDSRRRTWKA